MPDDEIVKGYEIRKGEYVHVTDEDFAAAKVEGYRTIAIEAFVAYEEIDPIYFERTYYLGPDRRARSACTRCCSARWSGRSWQASRDT